MSAERQPSSKDAKFASFKFSWLEQVSMDASLRPSAARVAIRISRWLNPETYDAWPSISRLAQETGMSERGVQNALDDLLRAGHLLKVLGGGRHRFNRYRPRLKGERTCRVSGDETPQNEVGNPRKSERKNPAKFAPESLVGNPVDRNPPVPQGGTGAGWPEFFEAWRFDDPTEATSRARSAFERLAEVERAEAIRCAPLYRAECERRQRRRKFASTWLQARGWEPFADRSDPERVVDVFVEADSSAGRAWREHAQVHGYPFKPFQTRRGFGVRRKTQFPPGYDSSDRKGEFSRTSHEYREREEAQDT